MGNTHASYHVRCKRADDEKLIKVCGDLCELAFVSKSIDGWAHIIDAESEDMHEEAFERIVCGLSKSMHAPVVLLYVFDSDAMGCRFARDGKVVYQYEFDLDGKRKEVGSRKPLTELASDPTSAQRLNLLLDPKSPALPPPVKARPLADRDTLDREFTRFREVAEALGFGWAAGRYKIRDFLSPVQFPNSKFFKERAEEMKRFKRVGRL